MRTAQKALADWQHTSTAEPPRVGHDGALTRSSARIDLVPSSGYGVVVLLDSYTPTFQHPFEISTGLISLSEGGAPDPGAPLATIIDLSVAALTVLVIALEVRGVLRNRRWSESRADLSWWRFALRQTPQAVMPVAAMILFIGLTAGPGNPATPVDAFGLWPAATTLVFFAGVTGIVLIAVRTMLWIRHRGGVRPAAAPVSVPSHRSLAKDKISRP